jgi:hypothetical protein
MPMIQIRSLPFDRPFDVSEAIEEIMFDFARDTRISISDISATWDFTEAGNYGVAGKAAWNQPIDTHPVLVKILTPDFHSEDEVATMLTCLATSISTRTGVQVENIFIRHRGVRSGQVFDNGELVRW